MRAARFLAIMLLLAAIIAAALYLLRLPIAGWAVRAGMASAGLENPGARVAALTLDGVRLEEVSAGGPSGLRLASVEADFRIWRLWSERKVDAVRVRGGRIGVRIDEAGGVSIAGLRRDGGSGGGGALPFDRLSVEDVALAVSTQDGAAEGTVDADYDIAAGGSASVDLSAERFTWSTLRLMRVKGAAGITFSADGNAELAANLTGDVESGGILARGAAVAVKGDGGSWRDAADGSFGKIAGGARIDFAAPDIEIAGAEPGIQAMAAHAEAIVGQPVQRAALKGALTVDFSEGNFAVRFADPQTPLALTTPEGAALTLSPQGSAPLYARKGERETSSFGFSLTSEGAGVSGAADIEHSDGVWRVAAPLAVDAFDNGDISLGASLMDVTATVQGGRIGADAAIRSDIHKATVGRLTVTETPLRGAFRIDANIEGKKAILTNKDRCVSFERMRGRLADQDFDFSLSAVSLCNAGDAFATVSWSGDPAVGLSGEISAQEGRLRFGDTRAAGRPPAVSFNGAYRPAQNRTTLAGEIAGGAMTLNDGLDLSGAAGAFDFALDAEALSATALLDRLRIAQHLAEDGAVPFFSPVSAAGKASLSGDSTRFSYVLTTPEGYRIGEGEGTHDMASARGQTVLSIDGAVFRPQGLQPNRLSPRLKGIVDGAEGGIDGSVRFGWSRDGVTSEADFHFKNISFAGPTRAVTRTSGVNGDVVLKSLFPLATEGAQTVTVGGVDLDALQLTAGVISFELPGDDTFHLFSAEFPWFGGVLGVYEATASFAGEATIPLSADNIDLKQVLEFVDMEGLSGEGVLTGELPIVFEDGKARIENGVLRSEGPGAIRYRGAAGEQAAAAGGDARIAFDILRDLRFNSMEVGVSGPLDGRLDFQMKFEGAGDVTVNKQNVRNVPVIYRINLDAALLDLLRQANLSRDFQLQMERAQSGGE